MKGFVEFIRKQGVMGLAVGFILGGAISKLVSALVEDIINPVLGILLNKVGSLENASLTVWQMKILWGDFLSTFIDFLVIALVIYFGVKWLRLDKLDKKE